VRGVRCIRVRVGRVGAPTWSTEGRMPPRQAEVWRLSGTTPKGARGGGLHSSISQGWDFGAALAGGCLSGALTIQQDIYPS
jgi:hypothetical protein